MPVTETKVAQASASWLSGGCCQRQPMPQAAQSVGLPTQDADATASDLYTPSF